MSFEAPHNIRIQYFRLFIVYYECATKSGSRRKFMCQNFDYTYSWKDLTVFTTSYIYNIQDFRAIK